MSYINRLHNLEKINIRYTNIENIELLVKLPSLNEIYVDDRLDRTPLLDMKTRFKNADTKTKEFFMDDIYNNK